MTDAPPAREAGAPRVVAPTSTREILALALPAIASGFVMLGYHWINQTWVGRLEGRGPAPVAALSVATFGTWAFGALSGLSGTGLAALVGRYVGAGREEAARYVASHGLRFAVAFGLLVGLLGVACAPLVAEATHVSGEAAAMSTGYLRIFYAAGFASLAQGAADAVFRGHGDTRTPFLVVTGTLVVNAALDPLFIFGLGPIPALGVPGAGLATAIAMTGGATASVLLLRRRGHLSTARPSDEVLRLDPTTPIARGTIPFLDASVMFRVARVGIPTVLSGLFFIGIYLFLSAVVTQAGGDAAQAGLGVGLRGEQVAGVFGMGFSMAASSLVARRLGAGRLDDAARCAVRATIAASLACGTWGAFLLLFADPLAHHFIPDPASGAARDFAADFYRVVAPCLLFQAWESVLEGAFSGAGLTWPPMAVSMALTVVRIPIARYVAFDLGGSVRAIWIVISATAALRGLFIAIWFSRGTWKHRRV